MSDVLAFEGVSSVIGGGRVLDEVSLRIVAGERVAVTGSSGCGKSLLVRLALGLLDPADGVVSLFGENLARLAPAPLRSLRARCGVALQGGSLVGALDVEDNLRLALGIGRRGAGQVTRRIDRLLLDFELEHLAARPVQALSTGERRRVELARAFVRDPELLLLDEPFEGAAAETARIEAKLVRQVRGYGRAMVLLTQDEVLARRLATRVLRLERGRLIQQARDESCPVAAS